MDWHPARRRPCARSEAGHAVTVLTRNGVWAKSAMSPLAGALALQHDPLSAVGDGCTSPHGSLVCRAACEGPPGLFCLDRDGVCCCLPRFPAASGRIPSSHASAHTLARVTRTRTLRRPWAAGGRRPTTCCRSSSGTEQRHSLELSRRSTAAAAVRRASSCCYSRTRPCFRAQARKSCALCQRRRRHAVSSAVQTELLLPTS